MKEVHRPLGKVHITVRDENADIIKEHHENNDVTPQGRALLANTGVTAMHPRFPHCELTGSPPAR